MYNGKHKAIFLTLAGTLALYASFAILIALQPALLAPFANPQYPTLSKVLMPVIRGVSDFSYVCVMAAAIYLSYRLLATMQWFRSRQVARKAPERGQIRREILLTANFTLAAGIQGISYLALAQLGLLKIYPSISDRGWLYAVLSFAVFLVLSDAWFYLCHSVYHRNRFVFRNIHAVHHLSVVTTPMTNSQISPWELLPSALFAIAYVMVVPMAMPVLSFMVIVVNLYLILLHSGYEIFPRGTSAHWLGRWLVTPTYHQMHHELFTKHFGLYFTWWDRLFGTHSEQYATRFAEVTAPAACDAMNP
jgi:sterol desaturase/sphingolipid hydroxylase (fatty acid hydroxylase superfamily)